MDKTDLRKKYKALRQALSDAEMEAKSLAIANQLLSLDIWHKTYFHLFLSIEKHKEIDTEFILQILAGKDKEIVVSKNDFESRKMTHFLLTDNTKFAINAYDIPEPTNGLEVPTDKIEVVFVPLLAYDKKGHRVGYGKGFYDIFLSECKPETLKIGLSFFEPEEVILDVLETDIRLDYCVTPEKTYRF
ncbi:MAG: 5-formyltetrahydrofolate cyclo-ligase [Bacteroidota bacterium]